jgi:hypothetical protein
MHFVYKVKPTIRKLDIKNECKEKKDQAKRPKLTIGCHLSGNPVPNVQWYNFSL